VPGWQAYSDKIFYLSYDKTRSEKVVCCEKALSFTRMQVKRAQRVFGKNFIVTHNFSKECENLGKDIKLTEKKLLRRQD
jgi:hypothetical protein